MNYSDYESERSNGSSSMAVRKNLIREYNTNNVVNTILPRGYWLFNKDYNFKNIYA